MNAAAKVYATRAAVAGLGPDFDRWIALDDAVGLLRADLGLHLDRDSGFAASRAVHSGNRAGPGMSIIDDVMVRVSPF